MPESVFKGARQPLVQSLVIGLCGALLVALPLHAQSASAPFDRIEYAVAPGRPHLADATSLRTFAPVTDYRWEGFAVGAVGLGLLGAYAGHEFCSQSEVDQSCVAGTIGGALLSALVGGVTGGLIGGLIDKH